MKRDMDLVREILLRLEAIQFPAIGGVAVTYNDEVFAVEGKSVDEVAYALKLIRDAGFLKAAHTQPANGVALFGLSWSGHDFLDTVRDPEIWAKTKEGAAKAGGFTVDLLAELAKGLIRTQIKKYTGVEV
jgi:Hypothetical protein (DUF2513)